MTLKELEKILFFECLRRNRSGETPLQAKELLTERKYREAREQYGESFKADMGAEAIRGLLAGLDLNQLSRRTASRDEGHRQRGAAQESRQAAQGG